MSNVPDNVGPDPQLLPNEDPEDDPPSDEDDEETEEDSEPDFEIPSLDDIIPWSPNLNPVPPPLVEVLDPVYSVQGINENFLRNVLRSHFAKDGVLHEVTVESHTEESMDTPNQSQRNCLLKVDVNATIDGTPDIFHMVIKTLSRSQPARALSAGFFFDRREVGLYTQIFSDINIFQRQQLPNANEYILVPSSKCFFARYIPSREETDSEEYQDIQSPESVIVLENVKCQGFTQTLIQEGLSKEQIMTVFEGVARLHGLSLAMKERSGIPLQRSYPYLLCISEIIANLVHLFERNVHKVMKILHIFGAEDIQRKLMSLRPQLFDLINTITRPEEPMAVLSHMNLWAHNILFRDTECVFVDWQMITIARPTFDLAFLLATSVKPNIRRRHIEFLLRHYYYHFAVTTHKYGLNLRRHLGYTLKHLRRDFCFSQLLAMIFYIAKSDTLITTRESELRLIDYIYDLDQQNLINPDIKNVEIPRHFYCSDQNAPRSNPVPDTEGHFSDEDADHISTLYPVYEVPEE